MTTAPTTLEPAQAYEAVASRDARFDGWFIVGVTSTGIYCRPSCPTPIRPKRENTKFFVTAAAAQRAGFRACKRCRPDASPGSPSWDVRADLVGRAMRLVADGVVDREGVAGLARRLAVSERHLNRLLNDEVGAGPLAIARANRAQTARTLVETTDLKFTDVAFAAGFSSVRQFNDTVKEVFALSPTELRRKAPNNPRGVASTVQLRLAFRPPLHADALYTWVAGRTIEGLQHVECEAGGRVIVRSLRLPNGPCVARLRIADGYVETNLDLHAIADLGTAVERCRRLLDLDVDPQVVDAALGHDPHLGPLVAARRGLRAPGSVDGFETAIFAILGQQVSVKAACRFAARLVETFGDAGPGDGMRAFPAPEALMDADLSEVGLTKRSQAAIQDIARRCADGLWLDPGASREDVRQQLLAVRGVGPWTANYVAMRALRDPDILLTGDLIVRRNAQRLGLSDNARALEVHGQAWAPWRTYATHHLWAAPSAADYPKGSTND